MSAKRPAPSKLYCAGLGAAALVMVLPGAGHAQGHTVSPPVQSQAPIQVPTTKILAIGSFTASAKAAEWQRMLPDEVRETVRLYLDGKIDAWFIKQDQSGVVFIMNVTDAGKAAELLKQLPFGRNDIMRFDLMPLGPLSPLGALLKSRSD